MSQQFRALRLAGATTAGCLAVAAGASTASAAVTDYPCKLSLLGEVTVKVTTATNTMTRAGVNVYPLTVEKIDFGAVAQQITPGQIEVLNGSVLATRLTAPQVDADAEIRLAGTLPNATGTTAPITFPVGGNGQIALGKANLNLRAYTASGEPSSAVRTPTTDLDGQPFTDSDGDPTSFNVPCKPVAATSLPITIAAEDNEPPVLPGDLVVSEITDTSAKLTWPAATDNQGIGLYRLINGWPTNAVDLGPTTTSHTLTGLQPATRYEISLTAFDKSHLPSEQLRVQFTTTGVRPGPSGTYNYWVGHDAHSIPKLLRASGYEELGGGLDATFTGTGGDFTGKLKLEPFETEVPRAGGGTVTARVGIVTSGKMKGKMAGGEFTATQSVRFKILAVRVGSEMVELGNSCQTKKYTEIKWTSRYDFQWEAGGEVDSEPFTISDLNGCAVANGVISNATASTGNTLSLAVLGQGPVVAQ